MDKEEWLANIIASIDNNPYEWVSPHFKYIEKAVTTLQKIVLRPSDRKLIIFDLNGILINKEWDPETRKTLLWRRPNLDGFLEYIIPRYDIAIWSSAKKHNVKYHAKFALGDYYDHLVFVYHQEQCFRKELDFADGDYNDILQKNLQRVWRNFPQYNEHNTIIVDDSIEKMENNPPECVFNLGTCAKNKEHYENEALYKRFGFI